MLYIVKPRFVNGYSQPFKGCQKIPCAFRPPSGFQEDAFFGVAAFLSYCQWSRTSIPLRRLISADERRKRGLDGWPRLRRSFTLPRRSPALWTVNYLQSAVWFMPYDAPILVNELVTITVID
jgi:hypothetical protein